MKWGTVLNLNVYRNGTNGNILTVDFFIPLKREVEDGFVSRIQDKTTAKPICIKATPSVEIPRITGLKEV